MNYYKFRAGITGISLGYAGKIAPNAQNATVGAGMLLPGHLAYVEDIVESGGVLKALISETNYVSGKFTTRAINLDDPSIRGYLKL